MNRDDVRELAEAFEAVAEATIADRGPAPLKSKGKGATRTYIKVDKNGKPTGRGMTSDLLQDLLERMHIEAVVEGKRPPAARCVDTACHKWFALPRIGVMPIRCVACREEHRREKNREKALKWHAANRGKSRENALKWHAANQGKAIEKNRKWREANREKINARLRESRARKKAEREAQAK